MLEIVSSNRLESLAGRLADLLGEPPQGADPWQQDIVLVYSRGLERWLSMVLADQWGICGNIDFLYPGVCLSNILETFLEPDDREKARAYQVENLQWTIYDILGELSGSSAEPVRRYIGDDIGSGRRRLAMSGALAQLYDQYLIYRPDWFDDWDSGKPGPSKWQGDLWRRVAERLGPVHRLALAKRFARDFKEDTFDAGLLPPRLTLFGISSLAPFFIEMLHGLGRRLDVHVFFLNPCRHYWGDIRSRKQKIRRGRKRKVDPMQLELPLGDDMEFSDLLATGGQMAKDFFDLLLEAGPQTREVFSNPTNAGLLGAVQLCLLDGESAVDPGRIREDPDFPSIQVHSCHSRMREVEVVYQLVLDLLARHRDMAPRDILVMAPRIEDYDSEIDAVFGLGEVAAIPYSLADRTMRVGNSVARTWLKLLSLNRGRMEVSTVLELLDCAPLRHRFGITENRMDALQLWIRESRIHWGWDAGFKEELGLPASDQHTWRWGLTVFC